jgi:hypothetical protein
MSDDKIITCVYCGEAYPAGTPTWGSDVQVLTDHIKVCSKHPMREAEAQIAILRKALADLVGADTSDELNEMEHVLRLAPVPDQDKAAMINAIHVLIETAD